MEIQSSLYNLLNPCTVGPTRRRQAYIPSDADTYNPSQQVRLSFPVGSENFDLSQSFINLTVELLNQVEADVYVLNINAIPATIPFADAGSFQIQFDTRTSVSIPFDADGPTIEEAIQNIDTFAGRGYVVQAIDQGAVPVGGVYPPSTNTLQTGTGLGIVITNPGDWDVLPSSYPLSIVNSTMSLVGVYAPTVFEIVQLDDFAYPRLDFNAGCLFSQVRVDLDSTTIIDINDFDVISSIIHLTEQNGSRYFNYEAESESFNGKYRPDPFRLKVNFTHVISLFRQIIPMKFINKQMRLYLTLNQANKCLVMKPGFTTSSYRVSSFEYHYSTVEFHEEENQLIMNALAGNQLIIPFINISNYSDSISQGTGQKDVLFNPSVTNLLGILATMRPESNITDPLAFRKASTFLKNKIYSARLRCGSQLFPLDIIKSVTIDKSDVTEFIEEYINVSLLIEGDEDENQVIFYNYSGQYPEDLVYVSGQDGMAAPTFVIGITTLDVPIDRYSKICPSRALAGFNASKLANVVLELRGLELQQSNIIDIFSLHQDYLVFGNNYFSWVS